MFYKTPFLDSLNNNKKTLNTKLNNILKHLKTVSETDNVDNLLFTISCIENIITATENNFTKKDKNLIGTTLDELIKSCIVFKKYRNQKKVSIFGSARTKPTHPNYLLTEKTAKLLTESGFLVITGAGPGIMEAGNKGALKDKSFGLHINLPFEQEANEYILNSELMIPYHYFFTRKLTFVKESDAIVLFPGGFGTLDEGFEVLTLIQTGRCSPRPFIIINYDKSNYWEHWKDYVKTQLLDRHYISPEDLDIIQELSTPEEINLEIKKFYSTFHSIIYINFLACIRLNKAISNQTLTEINSTFKDLLINGEFKQSSADQIKEEQNVCPEKPRLIFNFNHKSFGRLTHLIRFINNSEYIEGG